MGAARNAAPMPVNQTVSGCRPMPTLHARMCWSSAGRRWFAPAAAAAAAAAAPPGARSPRLRAPAPHARSIAEARAPPRAARNSNSDGVQSSPDAAPTRPPRADATPASQDSNGGAPHTPDPGLHSPSGGEAPSLESSLSQDLPPVLTTALAHSAALGAALWWVWPAGFVAGCWALALLTREAVLSRLPAIPWLWPGPAAEAAATVLQLLPRTRAAAWELGGLAARWQSGQLSQEQLLSSAAQVLQLDDKVAAQLSPQAVESMRAALRDLEEPTGLWSKASGLLSFSNLLWVAGALGLAVTLGPALSTLLGPLLEQLLRYARVAVVWVHAVLRPFYGAAGFSLCLYICAAAGRYTGLASSSAPFIALTGLVLAAVGAYVSLLLNPLPKELVAEAGGAGGLGGALAGAGHELGLPFFMQAFVLLAAAPLAVAYQSQLLGWVAAGCLFGLLGFSVVPWGLMWSVGWARSDYMLNTGLASATILVLLLGMRAAGADPWVIKPFAPGLSVFGSVCLFLSGLIRSSRWYPAASAYTEAGGTAALPYGTVNAIYALMLMAATGAGAMYGNNGMFNTGATFVFLFMSEKLIEWAPSTMFYPIALAGSVLLIQVSSFLKEHPAWLADILSQ